MFSLLIRILHVLLILFVIIVPFIPNVEWTFLVLHISTVMSLLVHWLMNNDSCFLTLVETKMRGVESSESFIHSIVSPVYKISDTDTKELVSNITPLLGLVSLMRLSKNWEVVKSDILRILKY